MLPTGMVRALMVRVPRAWLLWTVIVALLAVVAMVATVASAMHLHRARCLRSRHVVRGSRASRLIDCSVTMSRSHAGRRSLSFTRYGPAMSGMIPPVTLGGSMETTATQQEFIPYPTNRVVGTIAGCGRRACRD